MKNVISLFYKFYTVLHHFPQKISMYHNFAQQIYIFILKKLEWEILIYSTHKIFVYKVFVCMSMSYFSHQYFVHWKEMF